MELKLQSILAFLSLAFVASLAALPSENYWNSVLPNSPMPKAVKDLLHPVPEWLNDKSTTVGVTKGGVNVNAGEGKLGGTTIGVAKGGVNVNTGQGKPGGTNVNIGHGRVGVHTGTPGHGTNVGIGRGGVTVGAPTKKDKPVSFGNVVPNLLINYNGDTPTQLHDNPSEALFFLENELHLGRKMNLQFFKTTNEATFLPRQAADSIPFSSNKLPEILDKFSARPGSDEAAVIEKTIKECEEKGIKGEEKFCATSLESMVDFSISKLGKDVDAISTNAGEGKKEYLIVGVKRAASKKPVVVCHRQEYAYAVFYCHKTDTTVAYKVTMVAAGSKAEAVAVCHRDTAAWNPKHLAFQVLKVKPGAVPVCHFLPEDHIVWVPKY